jgi:hypothetical protein
MRKTGFDRPDKSENQQLSPDAALLQERVQSASNVRPALLTASHVGQLVVDARPYGFRCRVCADRRDRAKSGFPPEMAKATAPNEPAT